MIALQLPPAAYRQRVNWCRSCSPNGVAIGEPDAVCARCGQPIEPTDTELAATRSARNVLSLCRGVP